MTDKPTVGRIEFGPVSTNAERTAMSELVDRLRATAGGYLGPIHPTLNELEAADEIERLRALLAAARAALAPFAKIEPSSFYADDGSGGEGYFVDVAMGAVKPKFTGADLACARKFMKDSENV